MASVDLNLLRPLRALLEERSVSRAAARLHVAQPTMSIALSRLRAHFGDPLLIRKGNTYDLTPLGVQLRGMLPAALGGVERVLQAQSTFDPATSTRAFVIAGVDHAISRIAPPLDDIVTTEAPNVRLEFPAADSRLVNEAPDSLRTIDGLILPHGYLAGQPHLDLVTDAWVCLVDTESELNEWSTQEDFLSRPWVHTLTIEEGMTPAARQLQIQGFDVRVAAVTPNFHVLPSLIEGTDRVALVPQSLAQRVAGEGRVRAIPPPFALEPVRDAFWWHADRESDAEHQWLRDVFTRVRESLIADDEHRY